MVLLRNVVNTFPSGGVGSGESNGPELQILWPLWGLEPKIPIPVPRVGPRARPRVSGMESVGHHFAVPYQNRLAT